MQAVAEDSLNLVRDIYTSKDLSQIAPFLASDFEIYQTELLPWGGHFKGLAGAQKFFAALFGNVDSQVVIEEIYPAADKIIVKGRTRGTAHQSRKNFDVSIVHIWTLRDGKLAKFEPFVDTPAMLAALR